MDINIYAFTYGGKLSSRPISTEEEVFSWDISNLQECYKGQSKFKSPEFHFSKTTWVLFTILDHDAISFGIVLQKPSTSTEVSDCCCNISYRNLDREAFKSFKWKFILEEDMPLMGLKDFFKLKNSKGTQMKNIHGNAVIVCRFSSKRSTHITYSSEKTVVDRSYLFDYSASFLMKDFTYGGKLTSKFISTGEEELIWDITNWVEEKRKTLISHDFNFAGSTWRLVADLDFHTIFGIDIRKRSTSDEVFDCCCNISYQTFKGKVYRSFEWKFKCDKTMPLISMRDYYLYHTATSWWFKRQEGVIIVCRISSKKLDIAEACPRTESSVVEVRNLAHLLEQKNDRSPIVNPIYKCHQDLRQLLQSGEYSDVILQVGDQPFKAHRAILSARCSVFASMFRHNMKEKATGVVNIEDCDASSFPALLDFLYSGSTEKISRENVFGLYTSSDKYDVQDLKMECLEYIKNNLSVATFCETVRLSLRHSESELLKLAINFFAKNFKEIIVTVKWQDFISENPIQSNEILIKALASGAQGN